MYASTQTTVGTANPLQNVALDSGLAANCQLGDCTKLDRPRFRRNWGRTGRSQSLLAGCPSESLSSSWPDLWLDGACSEAGYTVILFRLLYILQSSFMLARLGTEKNTLHFNVLLAKRN